MMFMVAALFVCVLVLLFEMIRLRAHVHEVENELVGEKNRRARAEIRAKSLDDLIARANQRWDELERAKDRKE